MKKIFSVLVLMTAVCMPLGLAADDAVVGTKSSSSSGQLVSSGAGRMRVSDLERRVSSLERELRLQNDSIRSLERDLNDLRRRRL